MYRFTVTNNKADHKPFVVFFCLLALLLCLFLSTIKAILFCALISALIGLLVWRKVLKSHPVSGVIILQPTLFRFENNAIKIQGQIGTKSFIFASSAWLYIKGFNKNHWLIITANGVNEQSYARLKRAVLSAVKGEKVSK